MTSAFSNISVQLTLEPRCLSATLCGYISVQIQYILRQQLLQFRLSGGYANCMLYAVMNSNEKTCVMLTAITQYRNLWPNRSSRVRVSSVSVDFVLDTFMSFLRYIQAEFFVRYRRAPPRAVPVAANPDDDGGSARRYGCFSCRSTSTWCT